MDRNKYEDIIDMPHHVSPTRAHMSMVNRGAQFSPFAALTGYDAAIAETARLTDTRALADEQWDAELDEKIRRIMAQQQMHPQVTVTVFRPDDRKAGGAYVALTGTLKRVDSSLRVLFFTDGREINLEDIADICSEVLQIPEE